MSPKEMLYVIGGAILLTNSAILGTLLATGFLNDNEGHDTPKPLPQPLPATEVIEEISIAKLPTKRHTMAKAIYACEKKLKAANDGKRFAYQLDAVASRFSEETQSYTIFIITQTASRRAAPAENAEVTCEVSAETMAVSSYKSMKAD